MDFSRRDVVRTHTVVVWGVLAISCTATLVLSLWRRRNIATGLPTFPAVQLNEDDLDYVQIK